MNTEPKDASGVAVTSSATTRLSGPWLMIARTVWLVLVVPSVALFVVSLFVSYQQFLSGAYPASLQQLLSAVGLSVSGFNTLSTIFNVLTSAIWYMVGFLIFWRRSDDWLALLGAFVLVMFNVGPWSNNDISSVLALAYPALTLPLSLISFLWDSSLGVFLLLFPGGRLVPRWMGLILMLYLIQAFLDNFPSPSSPFDANCRHFSHNFSYPIQHHLTFRCIYYYFYHLARRIALDPDLHRVLDFALSALRHRSTN